mmetsp:Transcript_48832/g.153360  ORF Transcript_48832/g.153360 Transcript_48832/m.153360 type:complete len:237 (-) Transcript_48832:1458-2168(-)
MVFLLLEGLAGLVISSQSVGCELVWETRVRLPPDLEQVRMIHQHHQLQAQHGSETCAVMILCVLQDASSELPLCKKEELVPYHMMEILIPKFALVVAEFPVRAHADQVEVIGRQVDLFSGVMEPQLSEPFAHLLEGDAPVAVYVKFLVDGVDPSVQILHRLEARELSQKRVERSILAHLELPCDFNVLLLLLHLLLRIHKLLQDQQTVMRSRDRLLTSSSRTATTIFNMTILVIRK